MAPVTLPPSFYNSFWSPDYRSGLEVLFKNLEQGCLENNEVADFIELTSQPQLQLTGHNALASTLLSTHQSSTSQSSSSLQHTLLILRGASSARGEAHRALAAELERGILLSFSSWKERHEVRMTGAKEELLSKGGVIGSWEKDVQKLVSLRQSYLSKSRAADDSEDDVKFAPATVSSSRSSVADGYTSSPKPQYDALRRSGTVADRINEKLRAASTAKSLSQPGSRLAVSIDGKTLPPPPSVSSDRGSPTKDDAFIPPTEPNGKPMMPSVVPPVPRKDGSSSPVVDANSEKILLSGLSLHPNLLHDLLDQFDNHLRTTPAPHAANSPDLSSSRSQAVSASRQRSTILGTYERTFSGEEVVDWLRENIESFGGDWERCVEAASELHKMGYLSRVGVGRGFDASYDTYYTLKQNPSPSTPSILSPLSPSTSANLQSMFKSYLPGALGLSDEPAHLRLRREAAKADEAYKEGVRSAEDKRLEMEERIERGLRVWERWERERLGVIQAVWNQYDEALARLPARLSDLNKSTSLSVEAFNPEADVKALIEGNRTGSFRPQPHVYESIESDVPEVNFGIDLRKWSGELGWKSMVRMPPRPKGAIPEALEALLRGLTELYEGISEDDRRKAWIYEVPLLETHMLRNAINNSKTSIEDIVNVVRKFNVPVVAGTVKLYLSELNPPVLGREGWEDAKGVYPSVGADQERDMTSAVTSVLARLPAVQLYVLDAVVKHLQDMIEHTKSDEPVDVYVTKLALSIGRCVLRPQYETELIIHDRTPSLFLADLINLYPRVFPSLVEKKKAESDRVMPVRKRTALVDQRISRSRLSTETDPRELLEQQRVLQNPPRAISPSPTMSRKSLAAALGLGIPIRKEPEPEREKEEVEENSIMVVPPTPQPPVESDGRVPDPPIPSLPLDDSITSPTASIVESMEKLNQPGDADSPIASGASALKRATSGEVTRMRGPKGARGPRPAPGRVPSQSVTASMTNMSREPLMDGGVGAIDGGANAADSATRRAKAATPVGGYGHGTKSSVSQAIAQFEGRG